MINNVRKKPLIVEAVQCSKENLDLLHEWSNGKIWSHDGKIFMVQCLEALAETPTGSYVVKGVKGEVWPVREDIFNETYEIIVEKN
jgi:hypothetical protein